LRIALKVAPDGFLTTHCVPKFEHDTDIGQIGHLWMGTKEAAGLALLRVSTAACVRLVQDHDTGRVCESRIYDFVAFYEIIFVDIFIKRKYTDSSILKIQDRSPRRKDRKVN